MLAFLILAGVVIGGWFYLRVPPQTENETVDTVKPVKPVSEHPIHHRHHRHR